MSDLSLQSVRVPDAHTEAVARRSRLRARDWAILSATTDAAMLAIAMATATFGSHWAGVPFAPIGWIVAFPVIVLAVFRLRRMYAWRLRLQVLDDLRLILAATSLAAMAVISTRAFLADDPYVVAQTVRQFVFATVYLAAGRVGLSWAQMSARRRGEATVPALIVGAGRIGHLTAKRLVEHPEFGLRPIGYLDKEPLSGDDDSPVPLPVLGASWDLERVVAEHDVQHVVVTFSTAPHQVLLALLERCERLGVPVSQVPRLFEKVTDRLTVEHLGGLPLLTASRADPKSWQFAVKYMLDRVLAAAALLVAAPLLAVAAAAVLLSMGRPVLYRQTRVGRDGRTFRIMKLRSMRLEAAGQPVSADDDESRLTPVGAFLRRVSLDELPQLANVLKGDMSFVGPRPERPELTRMFEQEVYRYDDRHRVKSGITGWAQVHGLGRGNDRFTRTSLSDRVEWDNYYIENWSLWLDFKILVMTVAAVLRFRQA